MCSLTATLYPMLHRMAKLFNRPTLLHVCLSAYEAIQYGAIKYCMIQYCAIQYCTIQHNSTVQYSYKYNNMQ